MSTRALGELGELVKEYERRMNSHDFDRVAELLTEDASFYFSDGTFTGLADIRDAFVKTWAHIRDEEYSIHDVVWVVTGEAVAVCRYRFFWKGKVDGKIKMGEGRGTNVLVKTQGGWKIKHEHLSR